jgi:peptidyl-prolyl cis-trans isomerase C/foldase protein PrsA
VHRLVAGALTLVAACQSGREGAREPLPAWVAQAGGEVITLDELRHAFAQRKAEYRRVPAHEHPSFAPLGRTLLEDLIDRRLLLQEAKRRGVAVPDADVDRAVELARAELGRDRFEEALLAGGRALSDFRAALRERLTVDSLFRDHVFAGLAVDDALARKRFEQDPGRWARLEAVRALHIAVRTEPEARRLRERIHNGAPFEEMARRYSVSPEGRKGGDLGFFTRGQRPKAFEETCFRLRPGQLSPVTPSEYGYHLFKIVEKRPARRRTFEEARAEIAAELRRELERTSEAALRRELRQRGQVRINEALLSKVK